MADEEKENNFKRIAERRTNEVLQTIYSFRKFRNKSFYKYTAKQLKLVKQAILDELEHTMEVLEDAIK